jgi:hypothetical protein
MDRKDFITQACGAGLCSCAVAALFASASGHAHAEDAPPKKEDWRISFAQQRYARLLTSLAARTDDTTIAAVLEDVGRSCASTVPFIATHAGDPDGFFAEIKQRWHAAVDYDRDHGAVRLSFGSAGDPCPCGLVKMGVTPPSVCHCSIGWQKHAFEVIFGRPVQVELKDSLLRGGTKCAFEVRAAPA